MVLGRLGGLGINKRILLNEFGSLPAVQSYDHKILPVGCCRSGLGERDRSSRHRAPPDGCPADNRVDAGRYAQAQDSQTYNLIPGRRTFHRSPVWPDLAKSGE